MKTPRFWFRNRPGWAARLLAPAGFIYGGIARRRFSRAPRGEAPVPVICIGNPTVGGAGKTPTCLRIAGMVSAAGLQPVFLTRGYGGSERGTVLVTEAHSSATVGDEALLLAQVAPTVVSADRPAGARLAAEHGDIIVMDDGFQNPELYKDLALLVVDGEVGIGNGRVFPAGPLRLPLAAQLKQAHGIIVVGSGAGEEALSDLAKRRDLPVLHARLAPTPEARARLRHKRVYAFAGIGRPGKFFRSLEEAGAELVGTWAFADHHRFTAAEAAEILNQSRALGALPVTTEKDAARLGGDQPQACRELRRALETLPVELELDETDAPVLFGLIAGACSAAAAEDEPPGGDQASPASRSSP